MTPERAFYILTGECDKCGRTIGEIKGTGGVVGSTKSETIAGLRGYFAICDYYGESLCPECAEDRVRSDYGSEREFYETASASGVRGMHDSQIEEVGTRVAQLIARHDTGEASSSGLRSRVADLGATAIGAMMIPEPVLGTLFGLLASLVIRTAKWD